MCVGVPSQQNSFMKLASFIFVCTILLLQYSFVCGYKWFIKTYIESVKKGVQMEQRIKDLLNKQINKEFESAYLYLDFASYFERLGLDGYAHYYEVQAREEIDHALLIYKYLHHNNVKPNLFVIKANTEEFKGIKEVLKYGLKAEQDVTSSINEIYETADKTNDYRTMEFLKWFVNEQLEEEENAQKLIDEYDTFTQSNALYSLDRKYSSRNYMKPNL